MDQDQKIEQQFKEFEQVAQDNKNVDVAALMMSALQNQSQNLLSNKQKRWAYLVSVGLPPFGILFAIWFFVSGKDDGRKAAYICLGLTAAAFAVFWLLSIAIFKSSGTTVQQIEQIKPSDIQQLTQ